ncbi:hypothetical protein ACWCV9_02205 [Streptomyces sp. NPDC001606]
MNAQQEPEPGRQEPPVPRDMPDQQAGGGDDPWDVGSGRPADDEPDEDEVPDTDEAGSGPRGSARPGTVQPGHPGPDEPPA